MATKPMPPLVRSLLRLLKLAAIGSAALLALGPLLFAVGAAKRAYDYRFGFDRAGWLATGEQLYGNWESSPDNPRAHMVQDVLAHQLRRGMTRAQVLALLGPADSFGGTATLPDSLTGAAGYRNLRGRRAWASQHSQSSPRLEYGVGWGLIDPTSLAIQFDNRDRVASYQVYEH